MITELFKVCSKCGSLKGSWDYSKCKTTKSGLYSYCNTCKSEAAKAYYEANRAKVCDHVSNYRSENKEKIKVRDSSYNKSNKDKIKSRRADYYKVNRERIKEERGDITDEIKFHNFRRSLKRKYNLSLVDFVSMVDNQKGCCDICNESLILPDQDRNLHVDHNHNTGEVRSLLCNKCNTSLGLLRENKEILNSMIRYIDKHNV